MKVTLAPGAALPPDDTTAVRGTVWPRLYVEEGVETTMPRVGAVTVTFAEPAPESTPFAAVESTTYTPVEAVEGTAFVMVTEPICPGAKVRLVGDNVVDQPFGWLDPMLNVLVEHPAESLLVTVSE